MKKVLSTIICLLIMVPIINVKAAGIICNNGKNIDLEINNFKCAPTDENETISENLDFSNGKYNDYFTVIKEGNGVRITITNKTMTFDKNEQYGKIIITDKENTKLNTLLYINNKNYVAPSTTTTTTTTTKAEVNTKTLTVTLDPNDGTNKDKKTCVLTGQNTTCNVTLPVLEKENFNGWGTAKTCKEGNSGSIKVEKDITYYACYKDNISTNSTTTTNTQTTLYLKTLTLANKDTNEKLDIGTFSIKKTEYTLKVLNEVTNIAVTTTQEENINVEIIGNENLKVGENQILIKLTDENNNTNEYKIKVTRLEEGQTITNVHFLKSLVVGGYNINFNKEQFVYSLTIPSDINRLEITPIPEEETAMIEIKNNEELIDGSLITINVIGEDNEITTYTIDITKESSTNYMLLIAVGVIILLIIILLILIMIKSNKKKQNLKNENKPKVLDSKKKDTNETIETLNI